MPFNVTAGTTFGLSAAAPASYNAAGYNALTFSTVGNVTDLGEFPDRVYEIIKLLFISSSGPEKKKGSFELGNQSVTVALDTSDAGQALLAAALRDTATYSVAIVIPGVRTIYARALINGAPTKFGDVNTPITRTFTLEYTMPNQSTDGIVIV